MINSTQKKWLWLLVWVWLVLLQSAVQIHYNKHSLHQQNANCALCNFAYVQSAGPSALPKLFVNLQKTENIVKPRYHRPSLPWLRDLTVRAPPFLKEANYIT